MSIVESMVYQSATRIWKRHQRNWLLTLITSIATIVTIAILPFLNQNTITARFAMVATSTCGGSASTRVSHAMAMAVP